MDNISDNAKLIAEKRYLMIDEDGNTLETIDEMFLRVAKYIASAETKYSSSKAKLKKTVDDFYSILSEKKFLSGMSLLDRGNENILAACYVLPIDDSIESIYTSLLNGVQLHRRGAGIGYDFSSIRPEGSLVRSTGRYASGPLSFMRLYDFSSEEIMNKGAVRHAGHMGILRIDHPDIKKFICAKHDQTQLTNFNLSVAITDKFFEAYKKKASFDLNWPVSNDIEYNRYKKKIQKLDTVNSVELMDLLIDSIYKSAEPGFIFIDKINKYNPTPKVGLITSTNQCGEQPLLPFEACNLGSIDISKFAKSTSDDNTSIDYEELRRVIWIATRYLDNTITLTNHLLPEIKQQVEEGNRKIGLGIMGFADLLFKLGISYNSQEARNLADELMHFTWEESAKASSELGKEKGNFGNFKDSKWDKNSRVKQAKENPLRFEHMRNATVTTLAPTGTISLLADCNGGIEPFYALAYKRTNMKTIGEDTKLIYTNSILESKLKEKWLYDKEIIEQINQEGSLKNIEGIPEEMKEVFVTAKDIAPKDHVLMQSTFQKWTDNAVSKTINMPESATVDDIKDIFELAYESECKGLTIYRDKSRDKQVLN